MVSNLQLLEEKADSLATAYQALADASNLAAKATAEFLALAKESQQPAKRPAAARATKKQQQQQQLQQPPVESPASHHDDEAAKAIAAVLHEEEHAQAPTLSSQNGTTTGASPDAGADKKPLATKAPAKPKKVRDPDAPRRPKTIFFAFASEARKILKEELAKQHAAAGQTEAESGFNFTDNASLSKEIAERWRSLTDAEKEPWKTMYAQQVKQYEVEKKEYEAKKKALEHPELVEQAHDTPIVSPPELGAPSSPPPPTANIKVPTPVVKKKVETQDYTPIKPQVSAAVMPEHMPIPPPLSSSQIEPPAPSSQRELPVAAEATMTSTPSKKKRKHRKSEPEDKAQQQESAGLEKAEKKKKKKRKSESSSKKDDKSSKS